MLHFILRLLLVAVLPGIVLSGLSGEVLAQSQRGSIIIPDTSLPPVPNSPTNPTPAACMEAERLFFQQQAYQEKILPLLNNIHHSMVANLDESKLAEIQNGMQVLEELSARLMGSLEQCQQQARPDVMFSPCDQVPLLESAIQAAMEANRNDRLRQVAESRLGGYLYNYNQVQIRVPQPGTIVNVGQFLPQVDMNNLPNPDVNLQEPQIQELFRQLQQARMECIQSRQPGRVP